MNSLKKYTVLLHVVFLDFLLEFLFHVYKENSCVY